MPRNNPTLLQLPSKTTWTGRKFITDHRDHLPLPTGRYAKVGCRDILIGYSRNTGVLLRLFYPHSTDADHDPQRWPNAFPHPSYKESIVDVLDIRSGLVKRLAGKLVKQHMLVPVVPDVAPAREEGGRKFPGIVFSHGLGGYRAAYSSICAEIASHGFVVAAVEHRDNSGCLSFYARNTNKTDGDDVDDGIDYGEELGEPNYVPLKELKPMPNYGDLEFKWIRHRYDNILKNHKGNYAFRRRQIEHRAAECSRALDFLEALNAGKEIKNLLDTNMDAKQFEGIIDIDKATMMGHSFGGGTTLLTGMNDTRFKVLVVLDPYVYPLHKDNLDQITQPTIVLLTETIMGSRVNLGKLREILNNQDGKNSEHRQVLTLNRSTHMQQSDGPFVSSKIMLRLSPFSPRWNLMNQMTVRDLTVRLPLQFMAKHLDIELDKSINEHVDSMKDHVRPSFTH